MASFLDLNYQNVTLLQVFQKLKAGAEIDQTDETGKTALMYASAFCGPEFIDFFIRNKADINHADNEGMTPLMMAVAQNPRMDTLETLLRYGAQVATQTKNGMTPLMYSSTNPNNQIAIYLLSQGADITIEDNNHQTALMWALKPHLNPELFEMLIRLGCDANQPNKDGITPLMIIASDEQYDSLLDLVLEAEPNINATDHLGKSALHYATKSNANAISIQKLIMAGADINLADKTGMTPLMYAVSSSQSQTIIDSISSRHSCCKS